MEKQTFPWYSLSRHAESQVSCLLTSVISVELNQSLKCSVWFRFTQCFIVSYSVPLTGRDLSMSLLRSGAQQLPSYHLVCVLNGCVLGLLGSKPTSSCLLQSW